MILAEILKDLLKTLDGEKVPPPTSAAVVVSLSKALNPYLLK